MIIKPYGDLPRTYAPDVGEVVHARLSPGRPFARAAVTSVSRRRGGVLRVNFVWLETQTGSTAVSGERSHVYIDPQTEDPPLIRQVDKT